MPNYNDAQGVADLLSQFDFNIISEGPGDEVKEEVERVQAERKAKHEFEHPPVPEGFTSIEDLQASLNLGEYGDRITDYTGNIGDAFSEIADGAVDLYTHDLLKWLPDNYEWLEEADFQGLLEGCKGDLIKPSARMSAVTGMPSIR